LPWWKNWVYCNSLQTLHKESHLLDIPWWTLVDRWMAADEELLKYSYCLDPYGIHYYLKIEIVDPYPQSISNRYDTMQANDRVNNFLLTIAKHAKDNTILEHMLGDSIKIKPR